jgi:hypothetical protein
MLLIVIVFPTLLIAWATRVFDDNRKVKILRYDTVVIDFEALKTTRSNTLSYVNIYVLPGDDCYYIYEANSWNTLGYAKMKWRRIKELPGYITMFKDVYVNSFMIGKVRELEYTLVPVRILPDSIRENVKEQLKQKYLMPEHNDYDERQQHYDSDGNAI